jgi:hypothetical protein
MLLQNAGQAVWRADSQSAVQRHERFERLDVLSLPLQPVEYAARGFQADR